MTKTKPQSLLTSIAYAAIGATFFGAWGYWSNLDLSPLAATRAASIQASYSFILTLVSAEYIRLICYRLSALSFPVQVWATTALAWLSINGASYLIHRAGGTPNILQTLVPGAAISLLFCRHAAGRFARKSPREIR